MTESERERLVKLAGVVSNYLLAYTSNRQEAEDAAVQLYEGLTEAAPPSISGFALVGPDGPILTTVRDEIVSTTWGATDWAWGHMDADSGFPHRGEEDDQFAWLAAHGYTIRPVMIVVEEQTQESRQ